MTANNRVTAGEAGLAGGKDVLFLSMIFLKDDIFISDKTRFLIFPTKTFVGLLP